jgi:hypothetical protein
VEKLKKEEEKDTLRDRGSQGVSRVEKKKSSEIELSTYGIEREKKILLVESSWWAAFAVGGLLLLGLENFF